MYKLIKLITISSVIFILGCSMSNKFAPGGPNYADAKELPPLKFPAGSLAVSKRYDIPPIPDSNKSPLISDVMPPDYYQK